MKSVIVLSETDSWNRNPVFLGVFTTKKKAIKAVKKITNLSDNDLVSIERYNQTQGKNTNYDFVKMLLNPTL